MTTPVQIFFENGLQALGYTLLHFLWQGAVIAGIYKLLDMTLPRLRAHNRYLLSLGALVAMLMAAIATFSYEVLSLSATPVTDLAVAMPTAGGASPFGLARLVPWVDAVWLAGVVILSARLTGGLWFVHRLSRAAMAVPDVVRQRFEAALARSGLSHVRIRLHPRIDGPFVVGVFRSIIYLPLSAATTLTPEQLDAVLAHELEHVRRADYLWNLIQSVVETLFFFHPAVWWLSSRLRDQRELCCDDAAVSLCNDPVVYATALLNLEEQRRAAPGLAMALNGRGSGKALLSRIKRLLNDGEPVTRRRPRPSVALALPVILLLAGVFVAPVAQVAAGTQSDVVVKMDRPDEASTTAASNDTDREVVKAREEALKAKSEDLKAKAEAEKDHLAADDVMRDEARQARSEAADSKALAAQAKMEIENSKADMARDKLDSIDPDAIAAQVRAEVTRAKAEMAHMVRAQGELDKIDPEAIAEQTRAAMQVAKAQMVKARLEAIDAVAIADKARAAAVKAHMKTKFKIIIDTDKMMPQDDDSHGGAIYPETPAPLAGPDDVAPPLAMVLPDSPQVLHAPHAPKAPPPPPAPKTPPLPPAPPAPPVTGKDLAMLSAIGYVKLLTPVKVVVVHKAPVVTTLNLLPLASVHVMPAPNARTDLAMNVSVETRTATRVAYTAKP